MYTKFDASSPNPIDFSGLLCAVHTDRQTDRQTDRRTDGRTNALRGRE